MARTVPWIHLWDWVKLKFTTEKWIHEMYCSLAFWMLLPAQINVKITPDEQHAIFARELHFCATNMYYVYLLYYVCIAVLTLDAGLLARSQYPEGPTTGHLDTCFSWFPCVYKRMLRWFPSFQVATTCYSCSPPDLNFLVTFFFIYFLHICVHVK